MRSICTQNQCLKCRLLKRARQSASGPLLAYTAMCGPLFPHTAMCGPPFSHTAMCGPPSRELHVCGPTFSHTAMCSPPSRELHVCGTPFLHSALCGPPSRILHCATPLLAYCMVRPTAHAYCNVRSPPSRIPVNVHHAVDGVRAGDVIHKVSATQVDGDTAIRRGLLEHPEHRVIVTPGEAKPCRLLLN